MQLAAERCLSSKGRALCIIAALFFCAPVVVADNPSSKMGIFTSKDARVDTGLQFTDATGKVGSLSSFVLPTKPFILVPIFYQCPRLCGLTFSGLVELVKALPLTLGKDYSVVSYSFNPEEGPQQSSAMRATVTRMLDKTVPLDSWRFLTADRTVITAINDQLGFRVRYADKELEHSSAIFILSPDGKVRRYFAGVHFNSEKVAAVLQEQ